MKQYYSRQITRELGKKGKFSFFSVPNFPTTEEIIDVTEVVSYVWKGGDRYIDLANQYYGNPSLWWIIAFFNKTPIENTINAGEIIYIPVDVNAVLSVMRKKNNV